MKTKEEMKKYHREAAYRWRQRQREQWLQGKKEYRERNEKKIAKYYSQWYKENGRERSPQQLKTIMNWQKNNREKSRTYPKVYRAIQNGQIKKAIRCSICKKQRTLLAHHVNYKKPLEIIWVCYSCHKKMHLRG